MKEHAYELYYWPSIPGRGEFVRLALEDAGAPYVDVARLPASQHGGVAAMVKLMKSHDLALEPFAPPFLRSGDLVIAQVANILFYLGPRLGLAPADEAGRLGAHQLQLTITDLVAEVHDNHHPLSVELYYEDQKPEALRRTEAFLAHRLPKYLGYFERVLERRGGRHLAGDALTYVDLSMFQIIEGFRYAYPRAMKTFEPKIRRLVELHDHVATRPRIAAYLRSDRRLAFNEDGIFRHYPELDLPLHKHR
ncbi:Glutathione S-transferase [Minicystis rosea]|nr:Glutathione S-transferase [Minicystis rosea]